LSEIKAAVRKELSKVGENVNKQWLESVIDKYYNPDKYEEKPMTLFRYIQQFIDHAPHRKSKTGKPVCYKQCREYCSTFDHLKKYAESENTEFDFNDIDNTVTNDFFSGFVSFLQKENLAQNTIHKKIQTLKIFLNNATIDGYNTKIKYKTFMLDKEDTDAIYLNEEELQTITDLDLSNNKRLERVRDLFIAACWTGLRYGNWKDIKMENIKLDNKGNLVLHVMQDKTGNKVEIPCHEIVLEILKKYDNQLPIITDQKCRDYLKEIGEIAKLNSDEFITRTKGGIKRTVKYKKWQLIATHTARRSFATNLFDRGVKTYTIMQVTGHKSESAFYRYIRRKPHDYSDDILRIWNKPKMKVVNQ